MPRTKQPRKTRSIRETTEESDSLVRDFERQALQRIHKFEADWSIRFNSFANSIDMALSRLPTDIRKLTLGELLAIELTNDTDKENNGDADMESANESPEKSPIPVSVVKTKKKTKRMTAASDDGYATESTTTRTTHVSRIDSTRNSNIRPARQARSSSNSTKSNIRSERATRSTSRARNNKCNSEAGQDNKQDLLKTTGRCPPSGKYKTPAMKKPAPCFNVVTPKVKPGASMSILRRPREGEMVLSMQGSPLLVSSIVQERTANVNVPLHNGNVISLLPKAGLRLSHMPALDEETMQQLKTLKGHIDKVIGTK